MNAVQASATTIAVIAERQRVSTEQLSRIESASTAWRSRSEKFEGDVNVHIAQLKEQVTALSSKFTGDLKSFEERYAPIRLLVYGLVALISAGVIGGLLALVVKR